MSNVLKFLKANESEVAKLLAPEIGCTVAAVAFAIKSAKEPAAEQADETPETETPAAE